MNRERLLFVAVLAILGLWYFVLRAPERPVETASSGSSPILRRAILPGAYTELVLGEIKNGIATRASNVQPHPRPVEALEKPKLFDLPSLWPPTSRGVSISRLDLLRRDAAAPQPGAAQIVLPKPASEEGGAAGVAAEDRVDVWKSRGVEQRGQVNTIVAGGAQLKQPVQPWPYGADVQQGPWKFLRALVLLPDPERAQDEGVKEVWATSSQRMQFRQAYPDEIGGFQIAVAGRQQGYLTGLKVYLDVKRQAGNAYEPRLRAGQNLLDDGLKATHKDHREPLLRWSLALLGEARSLVPEGAQEVRRTILLAMLRAAGALNDYELVLALAIDHLDAFPESPEVVEHVGNVLASRTFSLAPFAIDWFGHSNNRTSAQRRMIEELVREGRFDEAQAEIAAGRAGAAGPEQDLLKARVALARADFDNATAFADRHDEAGGAIGADALQLLGAIAYAKGDAVAAAQRFEDAAKADPARSTAFSDWGLALAVQGRTEDALLCFAHALDLDPIDNAVAPHLGRGYLKLAAAEAALRAASDADDAGRREPKIAGDKAAEAQGLRTAAKEDFAAAAEMLGTVQGNNPNDLLVRYTLGYAKERTGNLTEAADLYRATIDGDSRYRIAIARLGVVQSQLALQSREKGLSAAAVAHLSKAVDLSPQEAILPYVLARFLMITGEELALADRMFAKAVNLPVSERNGNLPLWAELGQACLAYADDEKEVSDARRLLNSLLERIKDKMPSGTAEAKLMEHEVYRAARINLQIIEDNEKKSDRIWDLSTKPADWKFDFRSPMEIRAEAGKGLVFEGTINYEGKERIPFNVLEYCSVTWQSKEDLTGGSFWELEVTGVVPDVGAEEPAELGIGIIQPRKPNQVVGLQVKRKRTGNMEIKLDGGDRQVFKEVKDSWVELKKVTWPTGEFKLRIEVVPEHGAAKRRTQGRFRLFLNGEEVFLKEFKDAQGERANIFAPSKASQVLNFCLWVEGRDRTQVKEIQVKTVTLTVEAK